MTTEKLPPGWEEFDGEIYGPHELETRSFAMRDAERCFEEVSN
jgi:hypothetical protein